MISKVDNTMEREVYIEKIANEYDISKEAIYAEVNKLTYRENAKNEKNLEKQKSAIIHQKQEQKEVSPETKRRENTIISILISCDPSVFEIIKQNIKPEDFQFEINRKILQKLYEEHEKGNININSIIDSFSEEEQNQITMIMAQDYEINDLEKAIDDLIQSYNKEKMDKRKNEILKLLDGKVDQNQKKELEKELSNIIITLAKLK